MLANPEPGDVGWIGLAPHDAEPAPGCLARMLEVVGERPRAGLACADFGDGATPIVDPYFGGILAPATVTDGWEPAGHPHGTLLLARRQLLEEVGLFDERYFAYCEEADLALRAAAAGWETGLIRGAIVVNPDLGTRVSVIDYLQLRNTLLLVREHSGRYHATIRGLLAVGQLLAGLASPARRGPYWDPRARVQALVDHARGRYGAPRRPARIQDAPAAPPGDAQRHDLAVLGGGDLVADPREVPGAQHHAADHGEGAEHDGGHPHHLTALGQRPGPLRALARRRAAPRS